MAWTFATIVCGRNVYAGDGGNERSPMFGLVKDEVNALARLGTDVIHEYHFLKMDIYLVFYSGEDSMYFVFTSVFFSFSFLGGV